MSKRIINILKERDESTQEEAEAQVKEVREQINEILRSPHATLDQVEDVIHDDLGLEPDYVEDFLY